MIDTEQRPVLSGLIALVAVAVVVGVLGGLAMLVGVKALGLDGEEVVVGGGGGPSDSLYLPSPTETKSPTPSTSETKPAEPTQSQKPDEAITLTAAQTNVAPMQQVDLSGTYPTGEGAILQVQRFENGGWSDFPVTASVSGNTFATYVQTSRSGKNRFRVIDTDTQTPSNEVAVIVG